MESCHFCQIEQSENIMRFQIRFLVRCSWYPGHMTVKVLDSSAEFITLNSHQANLLYSAMLGDSDPRISSCVECRSAVVATEPLSSVLDELSVMQVEETEIIQELIELVENAPTVHLYLWEENDCAHVLWRDPLASEWSSVTGEKRLHR